MKNKPITYISTYRGVTGFSDGLHQGNTRDVLIGGAINFRQNYEVSEKDRQILKQTSINRNIDQIYLYLGQHTHNLNSLGDYLKILTEDNLASVTLVACDCNGDYKREVSKKNGLKLIESECSGRKTLAKIVTDLLQK